MLGCWCSIYLKFEQLFGIQIESVLVSLKDSFMPSPVILVLIYKTEYKEKDT
jgi:hypothetical protein